MKIGQKKTVMYYHIVTAHVQHKTLHMTKSMSVSHLKTAHLHTLALRRRHNHSKTPGKLIETHRRPLQEEGDEELSDFEGKTILAMDKIWQT